MSERILIENRMAQIAKGLDVLAKKWAVRKGGEALPGARTDEARLEGLRRKLGVIEGELLALAQGREPDVWEELDELLEADSEQAVTWKLEAQAGLAEFLFAEGPHPGVVMRRLYAWMKKFRPQAIWDAGFRELGMLLGESHGALEWRIGKIIDEYAAAKGLRGVKAPWQRTEEACTAYSEAQQVAQKKTPSRNGGKKSAKRKARKE